MLETQMSSMKKLSDLLGDDMFQSDLIKVHAM